MRTACVLVDAFVVTALVASALVVCPWRAYPQTTPYRLDPDADRANEHYKRGWEAFLAEDWDHASREFQQAIEIKPQFKLAYYGLGRSFMGLKRFTEAAKAYETSRDLYAAEGADKLRTRQEVDTIRQQDLDALRSAITTLQTRASNQANSTAVQNQIRALRDQTQRIQSKRDALNNNIDIGSEVPGFVSLALGAAYFRAERFADAERADKAALDADPKSGEAWNNLAVLYLFMNRPSEADNAVAMAEKVGYKVNPALKEDVKKRLKELGGANSPPALQRSSAAHPDPPQ